MAYNVKDAEAYIRRAAQARGIDPDIAVRVARSEGLARDTWQSNVTKGGVREPSYGPFQLLVGGPGTGFPAGMGNDALARGIDPRDPANLQASIDFALDQAKSKGWAPWYGAAKVGVGRWDGLKGAPQSQSTPEALMASQTTPMQPQGQPRQPMPGLLAQVSNVGPVQPGLPPPTVTPQAEWPVTYDGGAAKPKVPLEAVAGLLSQAQGGQQQPQNEQLQQLWQMAMASPVRGKPRNDGRLVPRSRGLLG